MKRGQSSAELLIIFSLLLLIFSLLFFSVENIRSSFVSSQEQRLARIALDDLHAAAHSVHVQGEGSQKTIRIRLPRSTAEIVAMNQSLQFFYDGDENPSLSRTTSFPVSGTIPIEQGMVRIQVQSIGNEVIFS
ncbi:MAG: hypothetical protein ACMXYA_02930 [Candidatus Woesearchaeota archaeon]